MRDERGFSLPELLTTILIFGIVLTAILQMVTVATHNQAQIADRVAANQRARPVMTRIVQTLHSACVAPRVAPVLANSSNTSISFLSKSGSAVSPTPDLRVVTLSGTTLTETLYPANGGAAPSWTFSGTPLPPGTRTLLTDVSAPGNIMFRYYDFVGGAPSTTPLPTPLSASNAARVAHVSVTFTPAPAGGVSSLDLKSPITLADTANLRLEPAGQYPNQDNLPCT